VGHCVSAQCRTDADCANGFLCASSATFCAGGIGTFACQTAGDQCAGNTDCCPYGQCTIETPGASRTCGFICAIGRPFQVSGTDRIADWSVRDDWCDQAELRVGSEPPPELARRLRDEWTRVALMEHASIAAFARFTLQLLSLGAPAELVEACHRAQSDETRHARLCFALASRFGRHPVGPGPLAIDGALEEQSLAEIVRLVIREGCVGETVAALEAAEACLHSVDPAVREVLESVREDELLHAELAWRFVRWAVSVGGEAILELAQRELVVAVAAQSSPPSSDSDVAGLADYGILPESHRAALRTRALRDVVAPCARALVGALPPTLEASQAA
jgi:hypothetical protein